MDKKQRVESFIKKYLTPRYNRRFRVEDRCVEDRFNNFMSKLKGIEEEIYNYISTLSSSEIENTRGYFYFQRFFNNY